MEQQRDGKEVAEAGDEILQGLTEVAQKLFLLKGDSRDSTARYCQIVLTDLEKIQAYVLLYLVQAPQTVLNDADTYTN